jgi:hypothetical protein
MVGRIVASAPRCARPHGRAHRRARTHPPRPRSDSTAAPGRRVTPWAPTDRTDRGWQISLPTALTDRLEPMPESRDSAFDRGALTRLVRTKITDCPDDDCDCWLWSGSVDSSGYAKIKMRQRTLIVHRYVYEALVGPIPTDMTIDHLCDRHRHCVNPAHFEVVSRTENSVRANARRKAQGGYGS